MILVLICKYTRNLKPIILIHHIDHHTNKKVSSLIRQLIYFWDCLDKKKRLNIIKIVFFGFMSILSPVDTFLMPLLNGFLDVDPTS